jgi:hypothetical protein
MRRKRYCHICGQYHVSEGLVHEGCPGPPDKKESTHGHNKEKDIEPELKIPVDE